MILMQFMSDLIKWWNLIPQKEKAFNIRATFSLKPPVVFQSRLVKESQP